MYRLWYDEIRLFSGQFYQVYTIVLLVLVFIGVFLLGFNSFQVLLLFVLLLQEDLHTPSVGVNAGSLKVFLT